MALLQQIVMGLSLVFCIQGCAPEDEHLELVSGGGAVSAVYSVAPSPDVRECLVRCRRDPECRSVGVDVPGSTCYFSSAPLGGGDGGDLNYFQKVCLPGARCARDWAFERLRGRRLQAGAVEVAEARSLEECQAACLLREDFACRAAEFRGGACRLSPMPATVDDGEAESWESNCAKEPRDFCNTRVVEQQRPSRPDRLLAADSLDECRRLCLSSEGFACRAAAFDRRRRRCALSRRTRPLQRDPDSDLVEVGTCFDVSVECEQDRMVARVRSNAPFRGRVYAKHRPLTCFADVDGRTDFTFPIALAGPECGTVSEEEGRFSNVLVIQGNEHVVTATDKAIGVRCSFPLRNSTLDRDLHVASPGSSDRSRGSPSLPDLSLHIVDMEGEERDTVSLGELLRVQVRMSDEDTYGIFVRNLVAKDGSGTNNLTLIDHSGCPVETKMMREVRTIEPRSKSLEGFLEAFTFTGSSLLELEAEVETCLGSCKPVLCQIPTGRRDDDTELVSSFGRRKREAGHPLATTTLTRTLAVRAEDFAGPAPKDFVTPVTAPPSLQVLSGVVPPEPEGHVLCFDPGLFALIAATFFLAEVCGFSACLVAAWRRPRRKSPASIHYPSGADKRLCAEGCK